MTYMKLRIYPELTVDLCSLIIISDHFYILGI